MNQLLNSEYARLRMDDQTVSAWLTLTNFASFGAVRLKRLLSIDNNPVSWASASVTQLAGAGIEQNLCEQFVQWRESFDPSEQLRCTRAQDISLVSVTSDLYPPLLKEIHQPPVVLFVRGSFDMNWQRAISIVGTRKSTSYGRTVTKNFVREWSQAGMVIISGLALGIDGEAHRTAVEHNGPTIAVVATGVDSASTYPSTHRDLAERIVSHGGAVISEFPPLSLPLRHYFPMRNRIIAGLSTTTVVVEADEQSGALITARSALEENRDVFAVPGPIFSPVSTGTNQLIALGATCLTSAQQVLDHLGQPKIVVAESLLPATTTLDATERTLLQLCQSEPTSTDDLIRQSQQPSALVQKTIALLELKGYIEEAQTGSWRALVRINH